jgi:hypothetical protein
MNPLRGDGVTDTEGVEQGATLGLPTRIAVLFTRLTEERPGAK